MSAVNPIDTHNIASLSLNETEKTSNARSPRKRILKIISSSTVTTIVIAIALIWSVPTIGLLISSFRPGSAIQSTGWWTSLLPPWNFTLANYQQVITGQGMGQAFINSLLIAVPGTILPVLIGAFAGYAFAWMRFPGRDWIFITIVGLLVVPLQTTLGPVLWMLTQVNLSGTFPAVWLAHTAYGLPFSIYLLRNFFGELPTDLFESAHIDGASHVRIFFSLVLPLSVPALASLAIFQFMWVWNDLLVALIVLGGSANVAPLTIAIANLVNTYGTNYQVLTAASFISMILPLLIFFSLQRYFVRGILAGSVKG